MKNIKLTLLALVGLSLASCLKTANDFAGLRTDAGQVVTAILEKQYQVNDGHNLQVGYGIYAGFSFSAPATESVRFFTLHISQPRAKVSGTMSVKFTMTNSALGAAFPAGAVTVPSEITVPENSADGFDVPVRLTVNKASLNPATTYAATFTITSVSQGQFSALENTVDVVVNNSRYTARYAHTITLSDPANQYTVTNDTKPVVLNEAAGNSLTLYDPLSGSAAIQAAAVATGAVTTIFSPRYVLDASGKVTAVYSGAGTTNVAASIDPSSGFTYNSNDDRVFVAKYTYNVTTTINGVATTRALSISEKDVYQTPQGF